MLIFCTAAPDLAVLLEDSTWPLQVCGDLFIIADFFMLDTLMTKVVRMLHVGLLDYAKQVQQAYKGKYYDEDLDYLPDDFLDQYFVVAANAYNRGSPSLARLRVILIKFIQLSGFIPVHCHRFSERVFNIPEFARDVFAVMMNFSCKSAPVLAIPRFCTECHSDADFYPKIWLEGNTYPFQRSKVGGTCSECCKTDKGYIEDYKDFSSLKTPSKSSDDKGRNDEGSDDVDNEDVDSDDESLKKFLDGYRKR